jgi:hypothetical protein
MRSRPCQRHRTCGLHPISLFMHGGYLKITPLVFSSQQTVWRSRVFQLRLQLWNVPCRSEIIRSAGERGQCRYQRLQERSVLLCTTAVCARFQSLKENESKYLREHCTSQPLLRKHVLGAMSADMSAPATARTL